jgi:glycosyltransferase involved in cell wall biosynthesis
VAYRNADTAADDWRIFRQHKLAAARSVGCWAWELGRLPEPWRHALSFYDELFAATRFAHDAFTDAVAAAGTGRQVKPVPMAVSLPTPHAPPIRQADPGTTLFLFAFDFRSHYGRKNPEGVIRAFLAAFPDEPNVRLMIKSQGGPDAPGAWRRLNELCADPRIVTRDAVLPRAEMLGLIAGCDAFVSLHRAEGFGRLPAEAMLLGRPVIATAWSGTADFVTADCAYPVDWELVPVEAGAYPGGSGQVWAEPDIAQAAAFMRQIHANPDEAEAVGARGRERIRALYDPAVCGKAMLAALGLSASVPPARKKRRR